MSNSEFTISPGFKGLWIPACIVLDGELSLIQKVILAEVHQLQQNDDGHCYAGNAHLCRFSGTKERNLRENLAALEAKGLLVRRNQNRSSRRRKLVVAKHVEDAIKADSQDPVSGLRVVSDAKFSPAEQERLFANTTNETSKIANETSKIANKTANLTDDPAIPDNQPGNRRLDPAIERRRSRQSTATESTLRVQRKNTVKKTTNNNRELDFSYSRKNASTHVLDENGVALSSWASWDRWKDGYEACVPEPLNEREAVNHLSKMVADGFDGDRLLEVCANAGAHRFWEEPPKGVVPKHLRQKYGHAW